MMEHMVSYCKLFIRKISFDSMSEFNKDHWLMALSKSFGELDATKEEEEVITVKDIIEHCFDNYLDVTWTTILKYVAAYG